jgi:predicted RNA-binding protein with RPS1 domain
MPDFPSYTGDIVQYLQEADLFVFSAAARHELDSFFLGGASNAIGVSELVLEQGRALSYLHAAEYSLLPVFLDTDNHGPSAAVITVSAGYARLALLKGNCSLILWTHAPARDRIEPLSGSDITVFSGDASKLARIQLESDQGALDLNRIDEYSGTLRAFHSDSGWEPAVRIAESGALELQGLLWRLKNAVAEHITRGSFHEALNRLRMESPIRAEWRSGSFGGGTATSEFGPRIITVQVPVDKIGEVIGPQGRMINSIQEDTGAEITIEDDVTIYINAADGPSAEAARAAINAIANPHIPEVGERFLGTVIKTTTFGAFVSLLPGRDGLLDITQIRKLHGGARIKNVDDVVKVGDKIQVEVRDIDERGKLSLVPVEVVEREAAGEDLGGHDEPRARDQDDRGGERRRDRERG